MIKRIIQLLRQSKTYIQNTGIKNKVFLYVGLLVSLSLILWVVIFTFVFQTKLIRENSNDMQKRLENMGTHLVSYMDEISAVANEANYDYYLLNYLKEVQNQEEDQISLKKGGSIQNYEMSTKVFSYALNHRTDVSSIMVFGKKRMLLYKSMYHYKNVLSDCKGYPWYQKAVDSPGETVVTGPQQHDFLIGNTEKTLSFSRVINSSEDGSFMGVVLVDVNLNKIDEICRSSYTESAGSLCILDQNKNLVYEMEQTDRGYLFQERETLERLQNSMDASNEKPGIELEGENYFLNMMRMEKTGWTLISITPESVITESIQEVVWYIILLGLLMILIVILVLNSILTKVLRPIGQLKASMEEAEASNLKVRAQISSGDELGKLAGSYNRMMERIERLMKQVVEEQEEKRKFELQALQAQINPHFLYNTLDSIIWMVETKDDQAVPMTEALAKLFRISLNKGCEFITLEKEMEHVRNYLVIQSMRYRNKFTYDIQIEDGVLECRTVKLIVQPLVENSIYHGIKKKKTQGYILIQAYRDGDVLIIAVEDDGPGMSSQQCASILEPDQVVENVTGSGVGVRNVNERIKLYFGKEFGLHFRSIQGEGTRVTISLPVIWE